MDRMTAKRGLDSKARPNKRSRSNKRSRHINRRSWHNDRVVAWGTCYLTRYDETMEAYMLSVMYINGMNGRFVEFQIDVKHTNGMKIKGRKKVFQSIDDLLKFYEVNPISRKIQSIGRRLEPPKPYVNYTLCTYMAYHSSIARWWIDFSMQCSIYYYTVQFS